MKMLFYTLTLAMLVGCSQKTQYTINVTTDLTELRGQKAMLMVNHATDSAKVITNAQFDGSGKMIITGEVHNPFIAELIVNLPKGRLYVLPVAVEPGEISASLSEGIIVDGTSTNVKLQQFLIDREDYFSELIMDTLLTTTEVIAKRNKFLEDKCEEFGQESPMAKYIEQFIIK